MSVRTSEQTDSRYFVETAARTFDLLKVIEAAGRPVPLGEVRAELGWSKPTTYRLLRTLEAIGVLRQTPAKEYMLGASLISLGLAALHGTKVSEVAAPHLRHIAEATGETTMLAVLDGHDVVYIGRIDSDEILLSPRLELGSRLPAHVTATGKMLLAGLSDEELKARMGSYPFPPLGPKTIRSLKALEADLALARRHGYAVTEDELTVGHRATAAPVLNYAGEVVAAVGISASTARVSKERMAGIISEVVVPTAAAISRDLGYEQQK
jgi:IclR family pca regulon transcriptional regulator